MTALISGESKGKDKSEDSEKKKKAENYSPIVAIVVAVVTAMSSGGFLYGVFNIDMFRGNGPQPDDPSHVSYYITKETRERLVDLSGEWRISKGDRIDWADPEFDDSSWRKISAPKIWGKDLANYNGIAWYRRSFSIENLDAGLPVFAILGRIDDVDEVFINGQRIGGQGTFPPNFISAWNRNRVYRIPDGVLRAQDQNHIAIRVYDKQKGGGITKGPLGIYTTRLPQPLIDLTGEWQFRKGDNLKWKEASFGDTGFSRIQVPIAWDLEGYRQYDGFAWYRKEFDGLPVSNGEEMVLMLGKIDDTDEVYLNGQLIGKTGNLDDTDSEDYAGLYRENRVYEFSSSLLGPRNSLAVRVHDSGGHGGLYSGPVGIMTKETYQDYREHLAEAGKWKLDDTIDWLLGRDS